MPIAALLLALAPLPETHLVDFDGPNGLGSVQEAVDAASSGDTIIVRDPKVTGVQAVYDAFQIDGKGLTIIALDRSSQYSSPIKLRPSSITNLPDGETVTLRNLHFSSGSSNAALRGLNVEDCVGAVRLESCAFNSTPDLDAPWSAALDLESALDVSLLDCVIRGSAVEAIHASRSRLTIYRSFIDGGFGWPASDYVHAVAGDGCDAIVVSNRSFVWIGESTVRGGGGGYADCIHGVSCITESGDGGDGLVVEAGSLAVGLGATILAGQPGQSLGPGAGSTVGLPGVDVIGTLIDVPGSHRDLTAQPYVDSGDTVSVEVTGLPGERVTLLMGTGGGHRFLGPLNGALLVNSGFVGAPMDLGVLPASGQMQATVALPSQSDEASETYTLQASCSTSPTRFRLTPPARVTVLGANAPLLTAPEVVYVNALAAPGGNGRSWEYAARNVSDLLESLPVQGAELTEVWLARGTYTAAPSVDPLNQSRLEILRPISLIGGFAGHESSVEERDLTSHSTFSADLLGDDRLPGGTRDDNGSGILRLAAFGTEAPIRIDGLRFIGSENFSAATITTTSLEVVHCEFSGNRAEYGAAGLHLFNQGAGDHHAVIRSSRFLDNRGGIGGAIRSGASQIGDLEVRLEVLNCEFIGNRGDQWEFHYGLDRRVMCGGAIFNSDDAVTRVVNCSFLDNESPLGNGGEFVAFAGLFANDGHFSLGHFELHNCAFANQWSEFGQEPVHSSLDPAEGHVTENSVSLWADAGWSVTNATVDPGFLDVLGPDGVRASGDETLRLGSDSVCLDAGDDAALLSSIALDVLGLPRRVDLGSVAGPSVLDIGAHERQGP